MAETEAPAKVGEATYAAVTGMIEGGLKPTQAFTKYAEETGKNAATVATAYYRQARQTEDSPVTPRRRRTSPPALRDKIGNPIKRRPATNTERLNAAIKMIEKGMAELRELAPVMADADTFSQIKRYL